MKPQQILTTLLCATILIYSSCKKSNVEDNTEIEESYALTADAAAADYFIEDASDVKDEALAEKDLVGNFGPTGTDGVLGCATITVTPLTGFPKTIVIDFGTGCMGPRGIFRRGKIQIVLSDSLRNPGSTSTMTFDNYFVNAHKIEGTIVWTNTTTSNLRSWRRETTNLKVTAPAGRYWLYNSVRQVTQIEGNGTPRFRDDDEFSIAGNSTVQNAAGVSRSALITINLHKKVVCEFIDRGAIRFTGPRHTALLDYGNGVCDNQATISINGGAPRTITLR